METVKVPSIRRGLNLLSLFPLHLWYQERDKTATIFYISILYTINSNSLKSHCVTYWDPKRACRPFVKKRIHDVYQAIHVLLSVATLPQVQTKTKNPKPYNAIPIGQMICSEDNTRSVTQGWKKLQNQVTDLFVSLVLNTACFPHRTNIRSLT